MPRRLLKPLRLGVALVFLAGLTAAFADFRGLVPAGLAHRLAAIQFTPALLALGGGLALLLVFGAILGVTLAFGRVYCSTVCPLGLLQDAIARLRAWLRPRRHLLPFARENRWLRYGTFAATIVTIAGGGSAVAFTLADPYSHFGRIVSGLFRPLLVVINNALVPVAQHLGFQWLYRVAPSWPGPGLLLAALLILVLLTGLVLWRERIYCNTLCPVGTALGLLARHAAFRLTIAREACTKCTACLRVCKAQCLDLRHGEIDASRCVVCFNCLAACPEQGIGLEFAWVRPPAITEAEGWPAASVSDPSRRALLAGALWLAPAAILPAAGSSGRVPAARPPATPPGAGGTERFLHRCTACQLCVSACPTQVLQPARWEYSFTGLAKPRLDFERAFCNYDCHRCGEVCPTGAIAPLSLADKQLTSVGLARFAQERCIVVLDGTDCAACSEHCPTKAVDTVPFRQNLRLPRVTDELCIGCGACEYACPVRPRRAITVEARAQHTRAKKAVEDRAPPPPRGGFAF